MTKNERKSSLSEDEKKLIQKLKEELKLMEVPREEWAQYIQQEITHRRNLERNSKPKEKIGFMGWLNKIWKKIVGWFFKQTAKRYTQNEDLLQDFYNMMEGEYEMSEEERIFLDMLNPNVDFEDVDKLGQGGASINGENDKKRVILDWDDEDFD